MKITPEISASPNNQDEAVGIFVSDPEIVRHDIFPAHSYHQRIGEDVKPRGVRISCWQLKNPNLSSSEAVQIKIGNF